MTIPDTGVDLRAAWREASGRAPMPYFTGTLRQFAAEVHPRFKFYRHIEVLAERLEAVVAGDLKRLMTFEPPRHGKSLLKSRIFPAYVLAKRPDWWVGLCSYEATLAQDFSRTARDNFTRVGGHIRDDSSAVNLWQTVNGGGMWAAGVGGPITGRGFNVGAIDDPIKNAEEADSLIIRTKQTRWYESTFYTRAEPDAAILVTMCMVGSTPVLMVDGTERALADIRPGDPVATYSAGRISISYVNKWKNQGQDAIFALRMASGRTVRANARHPFLVESNGAARWVRLRDLKVGDSMVAAVRGGGRTVGPCAPSMAVSGHETPVACVATITPKSVGRVASGLRQTTPRPAARCVSSSGMGSRQQSTMRWLPFKEGSALCVDSRQPQTSGRIGAESSASTMTTRPERCEDYSATTATSWSDTARHPRPCSGPLSTYGTTLDRLVGIVPCGREDVFDVEIADSGNFIAGGLVSHNTRWHEGDLAGWLLEQELDEPEGWEIVDLPAIKDGKGTVYPVTCTVAPDWRKDGDVLCPERYSKEAIEKKMRVAGPRVASALYQQRPSPDSGTIFKREWWRYWSYPDRPILGTYYLPPKLDVELLSIDAAFKDLDTSDSVSVGHWGVQGARIFLTDRINERLSFTATCTTIRTMKGKHPRVIGIYIEDAANGPAIINALNREIMGIVPVKPDGGKVARAYAVQGLVQGGYVYLPHPRIAPWVEDFIRQLAQFPTATHDDDVDMTTQALNQLAWIAREEAPPPPDPAGDDRHPGYDYEHRRRKQKSSERDFDPTVDPRTKNADAETDAGRYTLGVAAGWSMDPGAWGMGGPSDREADE